MFHLMRTDAAEPDRLNDPFSYTPHPLTLQAAEAVKAHLQQHPLLAAEAREGKMFGVLVCRDGEGRLGFLAAYSGQLLGRADWPWFVPAVFDYLQPDGYFKQEEARISELNRRVALMEQSTDLAAARAALQQLREQADAETQAYRTLVSEAKARRDQLRSQNGDHADDQALVRESQHQKAELRRLKQRWAQRIADAETRLAPTEAQLTAMKDERRRRSDALQRWLFDQFVMVSQHGERRTLTSIFSQTPQRVPPAGAGECCAPRLLQYAFLHGLHPLCIGEFWQGRSPAQEIRHHDQFYTACRGKCKPILDWMLNRGERCEVRGERSGEGRGELPLEVVYADDYIVVVNKPAGLLAVPGRGCDPSVESLLRQQYDAVYMVHRLDQDTSGLMVVALCRQAHRHLQRQFLTRTIYKRYVALLDGIVEGSGTISLPLRPDPLDRPRQLVDPVHGKAAQTDYHVLNSTDGRTHIELTPHTGRTHQLRVHCAHAEGLAAPIVGDRLYGTPADRLCLHAAEMHFTHPATGERLAFSSPVPF